jgi:hypothetical protein
MGGDMRLMQGDRVVDGLDASHTTLDTGVVNDRADARGEETLTDIETDHFGALM